MITVFSLPILIPSISFSALIAIASFSSTMLNRFGDNEHLILLDLFAPFPLMAQMRNGERKGNHSRTY